LNILYCGDRNICRGVLLSVLSLLGNVREPLQIYLLTASVSTKDKFYHALSEDFAVRLDTLVKNDNPNSFVRRFDLTMQFSANPPTANLNTRFTPCCMLRLYADLIPELPDTLLYLDYDVLCRRDPSDFYYQSMSDWELAGCRDYYGSHFFGRDYVNSGVLLLNMKQIRQSKLFDHCRTLCRDKTMFMPDQTALHKLVTSQKICPRKYNEQHKLRDDTIFQHFSTGFRFFPWIHTVSIKPWDIRGMHETLKLHEYDSLLKQYLTIKKEFFL